MLWPLMPISLYETMLSNASLISLVILSIHVLLERLDNPLYDRIVTRMKDVSAEIRRDIESTPMEDEVAFQHEIGVVVLECRTPLGVISRSGLEPFEELRIVHGEGSQGRNRYRVSSSTRIRE